MEASRRQIADERGGQYYQREGYREHVEGKEGGTGQRPSLAGLERPTRYSQQGFDY
jgi:hypothetical protein